MYSVLGNARLDYMSITPNTNSGTFFPCFLYHDGIQVLAERLGSLDSGKIPPLLLLPMYSQLPADLQAKIFESADEGVRK